MSLNPGNLFRTKALESAHNRLTGSVILINVPTFTHITLVLVTVIMVSLVFLANASFSTYESVDGLLKSAGSELKVYPREHSVIAKLSVREGQQVEVGDELLSLRSSVARLEGQSEMEQELRELQNQITNLENKKSTLNSSYALQRQKMQLRIDNTEQKITSLQGKVELLKQREQILKERFEGKKRVFADGSIAQNELDSARIDYLQVLESLHDKQADITETTGLLKQLKFDLEALPVSEQMETSNIDQDILGLKKQLIKLSGKIEYTLQARQSGVVSNIVALEGEAVNPNFPLLTIASQQSDLVAELYVPSRAIGFVKPGLKVHMRFDAFPHQYYGDIEGEVFEVSNVLLFPTEWPNPLSIKQPVYRVRVKLGADSIIAKGESIRLQKGLRTNADIVLEEKTVLDYLLSPIIDIKNKMH